MKLDYTNLFRIQTCLYFYLPDSPGGPAGPAGPAGPGGPGIATVLEAEPDETVI